jgi:uncharacterized protein (TIGR00369 family)
VIDPEHFRKLERMYLSAPINEYFRPSAHVEEGYTEIVIPVRKDMFHAARALHGSVYFKAMDDAAFFAANSLVPDVFVLTVSFNLYFLRPVTEGEIKAVARAVHRSSRLIVSEAQVTNSSGVEVARGTGTFMPSKVALDPAIGYV